MCRSNPQEPLRQCVGSDDWYRRILQAKTSGMFGIPIRAMTKDEMLYTIGFLMDEVNSTQEQGVRDRRFLLECMKKSWTSN